MAGKPTTAPVLPKHAPERVSPRLIVMYIRCVERSKPIASPVAIHSLFSRSRRWRRRRRPERGTPQCAPQRSQWRRPRQRNARPPSLGGTARSPSRLEPPASARPSLPRVWSSSRRVLHGDWRPWTPGRHSYDARMVGNKREKTLDAALAEQSGQPRSGEQPQMYMDTWGDSAATSRRRGQEEDPVGCGRRRVQVDRRGRE